MATACSSSNDYRIDSPSTQHDDQLSVHIVEDHNEVLQYVYSDIGNKKLPFSNICLVHFDSHPDLLCPEDLPADLVYDKSTLFQQISIGDWILPGVYAGHFGSIIWLKPYWADQICEGCYLLSVGKSSENHQIRVNLSVPYYLSEGFYDSIDKLQNVRTVPLYVFTIKPTTDNKDNKEVPYWYEQVKDLLRKEKDWILDIDLDFYSTVNPFKDWFTEEQYTYLSELYKLDLPVQSDTLNDKEAVSVNQSRTVRLSSLLQYWNHPPPYISLSSENTSSNLMEKEIRALIGQEKDNEIITPNDIHLAGMMTDLPHHVSTYEEIQLLLQETKQFLAQLKNVSLLPNIVTIARSSSDPYTPPYQVNEVQSGVLDVISETCQLKLNIHKHYLTQRSIMPPC